ncbi:MAG: DsbA family oxidoreductase [Hyphomonadaceae bacterium]
MTFDFISDISCPWCVIGLGGLERALEAVGDLVSAEIRFHPFELNPAMPPGGQNIAEHVAEKYGSTPEQSAASRAAIRARAAEIGFEMAMKPESRIYNTFDAHRLLHWAGLDGRQRALKHALFSAYFTQGLSPADFDVLVAAAAQAGLDAAAARDVLESGRFAQEVRAQEARWRADGVSAVPTVIVNDAYVISGGHPPAAFERAIRHIAAEAAAQTL